MQNQLPGDTQFSPADTERFGMKYYQDFANGCWQWTSTSNRGRGVFTAQKGRMLASRASWVIHRGPIPEGMHVLHACDNPRCVNPEHLFLGTHDDNMADKKEKGRAHRLPGERHPLAKITDDVAREIYDAVVRRGEPSPAVAKMYQVNYHTVRKIATGKQWSSATGALRK